MDWGSWHCTGDRDQDHPHGKEIQKAKWLSREALQIALQIDEGRKLYITYIPLEAKDWRILHYLFKSQYSILESDVNFNKKWNIWKAHSTEEFYNNLSLQLLNSV